MNLITIEEKNLFISFKGIDGETEEWTRVYPPYNYENIVSSIIKLKYDDNKMYAIINNYLLDLSESHTKEFQEMLSWRSKAKEVAKEVMTELI